MRRRLSLSTATLATLAVTAFVTSAWATPQEAVLHSFNNNAKDGYYSSAGLIFDAAGNLYGTTVEGGGPGCGGLGCGTVFQLAPGAGGAWTETVLYGFNGKDGSRPSGNLIFDAAGNLYGTTAGGGAHGFGTVFQLTPKAGGWTEKILHSFNQNEKDGYVPKAGLIFDAASNLYGTTYGGGAHGNYGTVFELTPKAGGGWTEKILYSFNSKGKGGYYLNAGLIFDAAGNLYGTTFWGGNSRCGGEGCGTVFELTPEAGGDWTEKVLHRFNGMQGVRPSGGLIFDAAGNLCGTSQLSGGHKSGTVFKLTPKTGVWTEETLHRFNSFEGDGISPLADLVLDVSGNLYGTTYAGGAYGGGTVFELIPTANGSWTEKILYSLGRSGDGHYPEAGLILDAVGNLYGTTYYGGTGTGCDGNCGTVFEITP